MKAENTPLFSDIFVAHSYSTTSLFLQTLGLRSEEVRQSRRNGENRFRSIEPAGARGHPGRAAHGTRGEDGAFGPRETAPNLLPEVGHGQND